MQCFVVFISIFWGKNCYICQSTISSCMHWTFSIRRSWALRGWSGQEGNSGCGSERCSRGICGHQLLGTYGQRKRHKTGLWSFLINIFVCSFFSKCLHVQNVESLVDSGSKSYFHNLLIDDIFRNWLNLTDFVKKKKDFFLLKKGVENVFFSKTLSGNQIKYIFATMSALTPLP